MINWDHVAKYESFPRMSRLPSGCGLLPIIDDRCEPYFHEGDSAVVDYTARDLELGELLVLSNSGGPKVWEIKLAGKPWRQEGDEPLYIVCRPNRYRSQDELQAAIRRGIIQQTADGPIGRTNLMKMIIGKVIGRYDPKAPEIDIVPDLPDWLLVPPTSTREI